MEKEFFDAIIIGRGLAGLSAAIETPKNKNTAVFFSEKIHEKNSSSFKAQGGIACAIGKTDSIEMHFQDTIKVGAGLCNENAVKILVEKGKEKIKELIDLGFEFDSGENGIKLGLEAGHSKNRILHSNGDNTGKEVTGFYLKLAKEKNIHFFPEHKLKELIAVKGTGKAVVFENKIIHFNSLIFASGGYSSLYSKSTNKESFGEANSIALNAGIELMDLEFEQFHPTTIKDNNFLLSERLRGEGAFLVNDLNEKFMKSIPGKSLATRDVVSIEMINQIKKGRKVFLDCRKIENLKEKFPSIYSKTKELGLKIEEELIEVEPAAHYSIGGIKIDLNARTNLKNVFAAGEASCSGVHGANRLASNSLLEAIVFGSIAGVNALKEKKNEVLKKEPKINPIKSGTDFNLSFLQELMWKYTGIRRKKDRLEKALKEIKKMQSNNCTFLAEKIIDSALKREESRGCHYRVDFLETIKKPEHSIIK
ncbi:FAD-binding protein [Candidatus Micrarchaeota archaeon]|nr:FAD-binding protein [Candidatus Micrarchaeota archaeon]